MVKTLTVIVVLALLAWPAVGQAQTVTVNWTEVYQQIDGFGAGDAFCPSSAGYNACNLTNAQADLFFSPTSGVGLSILRSQVPNDGSCATTCNMNDLGTMTKAVARGARVVAAPWSPPASMKSNGSLLCGGSFGTGTLLAGSYGAYATYLKNYVQQLVSNGITLYALSIQNEPDSCTGNSTYQTLWSAANFHD